MSQPEVGGSGEAGGGTSAGGGRVTAEHVSRVGLRRRVSHPGGGGGGGGFTAPSSAMAEVPEILVLRLESVSQGKHNSNVLLIYSCGARK